MWFVRLVFCSTIPLCALSQGLSHKATTTDLLQVAHEDRSDGDLLLASIRFAEIARQATDSAQIAEALYYRMVCGNEFARFLTNRIQTTLPPKDSSGKGLTQVEFRALVDRDIAVFRQAGFDLQERHLYDDYVVNLDSLTLPLLATSFARTPFGERARYDLITYDPASATLATPEAVISRGREFLNNLPVSRFRFDVYLQIGLAYADLWNLVGWEAEHSPSGVKPDTRTPAQELKNPTPDRLNAIKYLRLVRNNRTKLNLNKWSGDFEYTLSMLARGEFTNTFRFTELD